MIVIIDYRMGNLGSIANMFRRLGVDAAVSADPGEIRRASKLLLPGVGAFDSGMENLNRLGIRDLLEKRVFEDKVPFLGICLGMQLLSKRSEEGTSPGLGWIDAETLRFPKLFNGEKLRIPHMGWNEAAVLRPDRLFTGFETAPRFYFVHGYHVHCAVEENVLATTTYGAPFHSAVQKENVYGVQFHPEKSHKFGMRLLKNFAEITA